MGLPTSSRLIATQLIYIQLKKIKIWWGAFLNIKCAKSVPNTHFCVVKYLKFISKFIPDVIVRRFIFLNLFLRGLRSPLTAVLQRIILNGASKLWHWSATIRWMFYAWYSAIVDCGVGRNSVSWFAWPLIKLTAPIKVILFVALRTSAALNIHKNTTMEMSTFEIDACACVRVHFSWIFFAPVQIWILS